MTAVVATAIAGRDIWTAASVSRNPGDFAGTLWPNWSQPYEFALVLWAGLGCEALVTPAESHIILLSTKGL